MNLQDFITACESGEPLAYEPASQRDYSRVPLAVTPVHAHELTPGADPAERPCSVHDGEAEFTVPLSSLIGPWDQVAALRHRLAAERLQDMVFVAAHIRGLMPNGAVSLTSEGHIVVGDVTGAMRDLATADSGLGLSVDCEDCGAPAGEPCEPFCYSNLELDHLAFLEAVGDAE
jgi:hypothetical protein